MATYTMIGFVSALTHRLLLGCQQEALARIQGFQLMVQAIGLGQGMTLMLNQAFIMEAVVIVEVGDMSWRLQSHVMETTTAVVEMVAMGKELGHQ